MKKLFAGISDTVLSKPVCLFFLIAGSVYGNGIMFCFGNDPSQPLGTLSILCEDRKYLYWLWFVLVAGGFLLNTLFIYRRYGERSVFLTLLCFAALAAAFGIGLTLGHDVTTWNPKRVAHWISTGAYAVTLALSMLLFFIKNAGKFKGFYLYAAAVLFVAALMGVWLLTLGKSGLMEMIPKTLFGLLLLFVGFILPVKRKGSGATAERSP